MTVNTVIVSGHVIIGFTGSGVTVVATAAIIGYALVVKRGTGKRCRVMAITAITTCGYWYVRRIYLRIRSRRISAIMAGVATRRSGDVAVVKHRRYPCDASSMTEFAVIAIGRAMRRAACIHSFGSCCVMATGRSAIVR